MNATSLALAQQTHDSSGLYEAILGPTFARMPPVLQRVHCASGVRLKGTLRVRWSASPWLRTLLRFSALPRRSDAAPCEVAITPQAGSERWQRNIGGKRLVSRLGNARSSLVIERMGLLVLHLETSLDASGRIRQVSRRVTLAGMPLPGLRVFAIERAIDSERFRCDVRIRVARLGYLLRYDGILAIDERDLSPEYSS
ncbi:DUF4166 domain-containing protein [Paraburkholderia megapolitana]|uniref:DUF4166 domain-containing protein n=1 Tax=Paraburkholderia megapolitana TaxID=420953 RepID=UPI0038B92514